MEREEIEGLSDARLRSEAAVLDGWVEMVDPRAHVPGGTVWGKMCSDARGSIQRMPPDYLGQPREALRLLELLGNRGCVVRIDLAVDYDFDSGSRWTIRVRSSIGAPILIVDEEAFSCGYFARSAAELFVWAMTFPRNTELRMP